MATVSKFTVVPRLPERLQALSDIAQNLWWCWNHDAIDLFHRLDRDLWTEVNQNPCTMLGRMSQLRLEDLAIDDSFLAHMDRVAASLKTYMASNTWKERNPEAPDNFRVAYMSAEFGLHESLRIYSGGLGILAGDVLRSAADLRLPMVAVSLLHRKGYFDQRLDSQGNQHHGEAKHVHV